MTSTTYKKSALELFHIFALAVQKSALAILIPITSTLIFTPNCAAQFPTEVARWAKPNFAPVFINHGEHQNKGLGDLIFADLQAALPHYHHRDFHANYARIGAEMKKGAPICALLHRTPAREAFMVYSDAIILVPSYQLYITASQRQSFQQKSGWQGGPASLNQLLANSHNLLMGNIPAHSYGKDRDAILKKHQSRLRFEKGFSGNVGLVKMLLARRVDMILEFPWLINYQLQQLHRPPELLKIEITDAPRYEPAHIACPKNTWGIKIITSINPLLEPLRQQTISHLERWLLPEEIPDYRKASQEFFLQLKNQNSFNKVSIQ